MTGPRIVHRGSAVAQPKLLPVGKQVTLSNTAKELLEDFRLESCRFGQATDAKDIEKQWEKMQLRMYDLAYHISIMERAAGNDRSTVLKF